MVELSSSLLPNATDVPASLRIPVSKVGRRVPKTLLKSNLSKVIRRKNIGIGDLNRKIGHEILVSTRYLESDSGRWHDERSDFESQPRRGEIFTGTRDYPVLGSSAMGKIC